MAGKEKSNSRGKEQKDGGDAEELYLQRLGGGVEGGKGAAEEDEQGALLLAFHQLGADHQGGVPFVPHPLFPVVLPGFRFPKGSGKGVGKILPEQLQHHPAFFLRRGEKP